MRFLYEAHRFSLGSYSLLESHSSMKPKWFIVASIITIGLIPLAILAYKRATALTPVSPEWLAEQERDKKGYLP